MDKELSVKNSFFPNLDKIALFILFVGVFLTPVLSLPFLGFSTEVLKKFFLIGVVSFVLFFWFLARVEEKKLLFVKTLSFIFAGGFLLIAFISSLLSGSVGTSLVGLGFESGTFFSLAVFFILMFLVSGYVQSKQNILNIHLGLLVVFIIAFLFQVARLAFGDFLPGIIFDSSTGVFNGAVNLVGKWNDFAILAGFVALSSIILIELFPIKENKLLKGFIWGVLIASILTMVLINFTLVWIILAVVLFFVYAYNVSFLSRRTVGGRKLIKISLIVFLISLTFIIFGQSGNNNIQGNFHEGFLATQTRKTSEQLKISYQEVTPSIIGTYAVTKNSFKINPIFGSGPNLFSTVWLKNKPIGVNDGPFWNIEPAFGIGFVPTFFTTTGLAGGMFLVLFILFLTYSGIKSLLNSKIDYLGKSFLLLSFSGLIYVWAFLFVYVPETSILMVTFVVTGLFIACLVDLGELKTVKLALPASSKVKFSLFLLISLMAVVLILVVSTWIITCASIVAFQWSTKALGTNSDVVKAEKYINIAIRLNPQDIYYRLATQVKVVELNALLNKNLSQEELVSVYTKIFEKAKNNIDAAVVANSQNYLNYVTRGLLYENMVPPEVIGVYDKIKENYNQALVYNPFGPDMYLNLARLEIINKNYPEAEIYLEKSLAEKKNYIDAIFLQSQLYAQRGFLEEAINRATDAIRLDPTNVSIIFQLGYLKYRNADYRGAVQTFKTAIALVPSFANARYFLGLSYDKLGLTELAIKEFVEIQKNNLDNTELTQILVNLKAGRDALAGAEPIEKKVIPPVKQN